VSDARSDAKIDLDRGTCRAYTYRVSKALTGGGTESRERTMDPIRATLVAAQSARVAALSAELAALVADGNEYHAAIVRDDIVAAASLARLVHRVGGGS
jgi:hypothetical protein